MAGELGKGSIDGDEAGLSKWYRVLAEATKLTKK